VERVKHQKIVISRQNQFCATVQRNMEEFVVFGIAARGNAVCDWHHAHNAGKQPDEMLPIIGCQVFIEFLS
jgi:hypothetical protein